MRFLCSWSTLALFFVVFLKDVAQLVYAFSGRQVDPQSSKNAVKVLVTGAAGKTGRVVLSKLEQDHRYEPKGLFRTERSARSIVKSDDTRCPLEHVVIADVTSPTFLEDLSEVTHRVGESEGNVDVDEFDESDDENKSNNGSSNKSSNGLENMDAMIICTSAVPRIRKRSLATMLLKAPWRALRREPIMDFRSMRFAWKHGGHPEKVDYQGQVAQIDLAKRLGIPHVVLVSSMGGTDPDNFLNSVGKTKSKTKTKQEGHGDILLWKRRAEKYLVESGLDYTILHPGGLVDIPGGQDEFVLDVDDKLYELNHHQTTTNTDQRRSMTRISREDVAELCVAALSAGKGKKISFDCITVPSSSASSSLLSTATIDGNSDSDEGNDRNIRENKETAASSATATTSISTSTSTATPSAATITTATVSKTSGTSTEDRKSAEEALTEFLDLSITTNYDLEY